MEIHQLSKEQSDIRLNNDSKTPSELHAQEQNSYLGSSGESIISLKSKNSSRSVQDSVDVPNEEKRETPSG